MNLTESNCSVDKGSGAVLFHKSPELQEIMKLREEIKNLNDKIEQILELLGGIKHG